MGEPPPIPVAPAEVAVGIPADHLRRRPDVRAAEAQAAAQCAPIGVAKAGLYPAFTSSGTIGLLSTTIGTAGLFVDPGGTRRQRTRRPTAPIASARRGQSSCIDGWRWAADLGAAGGKARARGGG